jgi:uncharacterized membrane protein
VRQPEKNDNFGPIEQLVLLLFLFPLTLSLISLDLMVGALLQLVFTTLLITKFSGHSKS